MNKKEEAIEKAISEGDYIKALYIHKFWEIDREREIEILRKI